MPSYLQLCQKVARESGTIQGVQPTSVVAQVGRLAKMVAWVADAWREIQNSQAQWRWLQAEGTATISPGTQRYTAAGWNLDRWGEWLTDAYDDEGIVFYPHTAYLQSDGVEREAPLREISWEQYRRSYSRGQQTPKAPHEYAISPAGEFCVAVPDDTYVWKGEYRRSPQVLTANDEIPECPERFHDVIVWRAIMLMSEFDEGGVQLAAARWKYADILAQLQRDQLPRVMIGSNSLDEY